MRESCNWYTFSTPVENHDAVEAVVNGWFVWSGIIF